MCRSELGTHEKLLRPDWIGRTLRSPWRKGSAKKSQVVMNATPVPETDTGGQVEDTKGREITLSKELGKIAP